MKFCSILLINCVLLNLTIAAQNPQSIAPPKTGNAFLDFFSIQYKPVQTLLTDSLFVRIQGNNAGTVEREIAFQYPEKSTEVAAWREIRKESDGQRIWKLSQKVIPAANGRVVESENLDSITHWYLKDRVTYMGSDPSRPDSLFYEQWDSTVWQPVHKTNFVYKSGNLIAMRKESHWDTGAATWLDQSASNYDYDATGRLTFAKLEV